MSVFIGYPSFMAYQMMKGKKGNNDGFPSIPGMIARYSALGLTNEQMAANPVWKDLTGNGHDLQMKNFPWAGMSGVGGYSDNFSSDFWKKPSDRSDITWTSSSFNITRVMNTGVQIYYHSAWEESESVIPEKRIIVKGLEDGQVLRYMNVGNIIIEISQDGIYTIPSFTFKGANSYHGYSLAKKQESCNVTVEQLPLYPGFILGDGVDDFAVTEKELNFEDTYTVYTAFIPFQSNSVRNMILCGADSKKTFSMQYSSLVYVSFIAGNNYYINADFVNGLNLFACKRNGNNICIKNLLTNKVVTGTCGDWVENAGLYYVWKNATYASFARAGIAGQIIANGHFTTDEEDENILDWHKKQYPWLFPGQAWTVTGKTNEDKDSTTIANITGNGNNLVLSNFGFIEGSGYNKEGEYAGYLVTDGVDDMISSSIFEIGKDFTIIGEWKFMDNIIANAGISKALSLFVYNTNNGLRIFINNTTKGPVLNTKTLKAICSDGRVYSDDWSEMIVNEEQPITSSKSSLLIGINGNNFAKIALKNLAIYNQLLSKDDCIKAYNYLQTLKAK